MRPPWQPRQSTKAPSLLSPPDAAGRVAIGRPRFWLAWNPYIGRVVRTRGRQTPGRVVMARAAQRYEPKMSEAAVGSRPTAMMTGRRSPESRREGEAPGLASRTVAAAILLRAVQAPGPGRNDRYAWND